MSSKSEVFEFSSGQKPPIKGGYMWPAMPIFELGLAIPVKSCVWKFGSDWLSLSRVIIWIFRGGRNPLLGGFACDLQCPLSDLDELFQSKVICVNLVRIGWAFQELSCPQTFFYGGRNPLLGRVTFDLWSPFLNSGEIFQSKVMCGNLVWIGWNRRYVNFEGGRRRGLHVTCDAHFWT